METNETRKGKYNKIILKEKKIPNMNKPNKEGKIRKNKTYKTSQWPSAGTHGGLHSGLWPRAPTSGILKLRSGHWKYL
jgi:hypothetical protein